MVTMRDEARAVRQALLDDIVRWRGEVRTLGVRGTLGAGIALQAAKRSEEVIGLVTRHLDPNADLTGLTLGQLIIAFLKAVQKDSSASGGEATPQDRDTLSRLRNLRNTVAHATGPVGPDQVEDVLTAAEAVMRMPLIRTLLAIP